MCGKESEMIMYQMSTKLASQTPLNEHIMINLPPKSEYLHSLTLKVKKPFLGQQLKVINSDSESIAKYFMLTDYS